MREKGQKKTTEDDDDADDEGRLAGGAARQGSKLPPRAPPILLTVEEELDGGKGSSTVPLSELSAFKMAAFVSHVSGSVFLEAQDGDVMDALLRLPRRRRPAHLSAAGGAGSPAFTFPQPGLSPDCTPPFPRNGWSSSPYAERGTVVAEDMGGAGCAQWGEGAAWQSEWQAAEGMGGMGSGDDEDEDGMGTAGGFDCGEWGEADAGGADAHGSHAGEWSGGVGGSGSGAGSGGGLDVPGSAQNKSGSKRGSGKGSGKGSASGRGGGQGEAAVEYDPFAPLDPDDAGCMPQRPLRKGRPYLRAKRKTDGGDLTSSLSDLGVWLSFPLLAGKGRGMIFPDIESIMQRAVIRDSKRQQGGVPKGSFDGGGSQKVGRDGREEGGGWWAWQAGSALEPPAGNVFADLEANPDDGERAHGSHGSAHRGGAGGAHGDANAGADGHGAQGFGFDGMDIEDDDECGGDGAAGSDGEDGEGERTGVEHTPLDGNPLPGMDWEANVLHSDTPLPADPSAPHVATVEAMRDAHVAEMIQRAAEMQARRSEVETRVGDWQSRILPLLEQQKHMQQEQQRQQEQQEMGEMEGAGQGAEGRQQQQLCEDLFENVINTPLEYEVNNGNVSLSVDPHGLLQPTSLPLSSSSHSSAIAPPVEASSSLTSTAPSSSAPRCYSRGSSFFVRLHSLNRRQEELRGYVAPVLTETSKGVNGREVLEERNEEKRRKLVDESTEEGEVEEARERVIGDEEEEEDEDCGRTERAGVDEIRRCREQEEMLLHSNCKRQKKDGMQATGGSALGSSLGSHSNVGSFQRCAEAVRGSGAAASMLGAGKAASPVPVARRKDSRSSSLLGRRVAARLERSRSWKERQSVLRIKRKLGADCVVQPLFPIQRGHAETAAVAAPSYPASPLPPPRHSLSLPPLRRLSLPSRRRLWWVHEHERGFLHDRTLFSEAPLSQRAGALRAGALRAGALRAGALRAAPSALAPCALAPCALAPCALAPCALAPSALAPSALARCALARCTLAPCALAPCALAPSALAPCALAPTALAPCALAPTTLAPCALAPNALPP
ncbi:unnamed protein product [Closterium sp. Naga37s-1]|nr:unnamed protein product [Closterium sp. Naga37s-1]